MTLILLAYIAGGLTLLSPCILPVLPFLLAGGGKPFRQGALPLLVGMASAFAIVASLAAFAGGWAARLGQVGRDIALIWLAGLGLVLLWPALAARVFAPLAAWGERLLARTGPSGMGPSSSTEGPAWPLVTGVATGLVWAPCAGPVLGLILTGAALRGPSLDTTIQLLAFGAGAASALAVVNSASEGLRARLRQVARATEWPRRAVGALILGSVAVLVLGSAQQVLLRVPSTATNFLEDRLIDLWLPDDSAPLADAGAEAPDEAGAGAGAGAAGPARAVDGAGPVQAAWWSGGPAGDEGPAPGLDGATRWFNGPPLTAAALRGKVVLVNFWTYSCINCLRNLPAVRAWARQYGPQGLVVVGVHTPEFAFEKDPANVARALQDLHLDYPVAQDNDFRLWRAFHNSYWPAMYLIDAQGHIRHHQFGEDGQAQTEQAIQTLLREAGQAPAARADIGAEARGVGLPADLRDLRSPESYIGYAQAVAMASPERLSRDRASRYTAGTLGLNEWALAGLWNVGPEYATLAETNGAIAVRFHARDLHLVMAGPVAASASGPGAASPQRFVVTLDGHPPGEEHGVDVDAQGNGVVDASRLYQLIRQRQDVRDRRVEIRFLAPGVRAYAFTFG